MDPTPQPMGMEMCIRDRSYDESGEVVEYTVSLYRGDRYSYSVEISK